MSKKILQGILVLLGLLFTFRFFLPGIILGGAFLAPGLPANPHLDSEARFLSALAGGYAALFFYMLKDTERKGPLILIIAASVFLGGLMRIVSMVTVGMPAPNELLAIALEIGIPSMVLFLNHNIAKARRAEAAAIRL
jgi:hypothetical protein